MIPPKTPNDPPPHDAATPVITPANEALRRPEPYVIDQRQQQIDPAGRKRVDVNAPASETMKQPGGDGPADDGAPPHSPEKTPR